ncbi:sperm-associated antigen 17 [Channa argus]|uniref:sperm-associated antigen 17 n=1 Tax=Channa argus TaxID=215402 RepID=UPI00351FD3FD
MPPKSSQKGSPKKPTAAEGAVVDKNWEAGLIKAQFEEDAWQACVCWVVGSSPADEELVQALALAFRRPQYKLFTPLTWDSTLSKIHELGNPKTKKSDVPLYYEVTAAAKVLLDAGEAIPCDLMAKILKFQLLAVKANDQKRREAENEKIKASALSASKERGGVKKASPLEASKEKTKLKHRKDVDSPVFKDEEPDDGPQHYILVLGFYQPHLIEALDALGVHVANVIKLCSQQSQSSAVQQEQTPAEGNEQSQEASPPLDADSDGEKAAQVRKLDLFWSFLRPVLDSAPLDSKLHSVAQLSYSVPDVLPSLPTQDPESVLELGSQILEGVASLIFDSVDWRRQHQHYLDNLKLISVPAAVRLDFQSLEDVPTPLSSVPLSQNFKKKSAQEEILPTQESKLHPLSTHVDMRYYSNLLDLVPPEAYSVPIILHCMLEQVVVSTEQPVSEKPRPPGGPWLDQQLVGYMLQSFLPLVHTEEEKELMLNSLVNTVQKEEEKKRLVQKFGAQVTRKKLEHPLVIRHHDERAVRLKDVSPVEGFDPAEVELSMMRLSPVCGLIQSVALQKNRNSCWMAIKQQLQHYCTDDVVSWPEVERLIHQSVFESMPLTRPDQYGVLLKTAGSLGTLEPAHQQIPSVIPWDDPLSYAKRQLHNLQTKGATFLTEDPANTEHLSDRVYSHLDLNDIQSCRLRNLFDWHYAEHHDSSVFPQVLQLASEEYCCLDTFRGSHNNILYIFCHNPMGSQCHSKEFWGVALHTNVKFRKYLEHVADTIGEWIREEELKREEMQLRNLIPAGSPEDEMPSNGAEEENALEPVIRKDSLKAWKLEQDRLKEDETAKKLKKETGLKVKQPSDDDKLTEKSKTSGGKSVTETAGSLAKTESVTTTVEEKNVLQQAEEDIQKGFTGYDLDGKLIHVSGCVQRLFPSDGGHIAVENISYVEGSSLMKVAVNKDGHHFYTHINHVVDVVKPPPQFQNNDTSEKKKDCKESESVQMKRVKQGSLTAVLDSGVRLSYSFYGPTGQYIVSPKPAERGIAETCTLLPIPPPSPTQHPKGEELEPASSKTHTPASQATVCEGQPFNCLNLSVPNGLLLQFLRENAKEVSTEEQSMLVRQSFSFHGGEEVKQLQDPSLSKELSRIITSQGTVIRYMRDGSTEVLFADGSVSVSEDCGPVWVPDCEVDMNSQEAEDNKKEVSSPKGAQRGCWSTTTPSGARICTVGTTHKYIPTTPLLTFKATDPVTHEVMLSREDLVVSVQNIDGSLSVEHADGTRITSLYKDGPPHTYVLRHAGNQSESVTLKSTPECVCDYTECVCATRCADTINEKSHIQGTPDSGDEISGGCEREDAGPARAMLSACEDVGPEQQRAESRSCKTGEESVFAEEAVAEINERNSRESEKGSVTAKERVVVVEKEGCATVVMYPGQRTVHAFLADGTVITGNNQGAYQVFPSSVGLLQIQSDGRCVYSSDSLVTPSPMDGSPTNPPGSYTFSHSDKVACDVTDPDGNHFQVMEDGQISVLNFSPAPSTLKPDEEESEADQEESTDFQVKFREHFPRLFLVHEDGSGTELLSSQNVEELLYQAYNDPATALLKEPLPHTQDEFAITILKPSHQSVWSQWVLSKQNPDITPPNLRNHSWLDYPRAETNITGLQSGTDMGPGLNLRDGSIGFTAQRQPVRSCPKVLEMRELYQHQPFSTALRNTIDTRLKEYIEVLMEREQRSEERQVKDPRSEEESAHARDLLSMVLSFAEEEDANRIFVKRTSVDIASLYSKGVKQPDVSVDTTTAASDSFVNRKESKWTERLAQHRQQMCEEKACRAALRNKNIVSYFHSENTPLYQSLLQQQTPDMRALSMDLPPFPKSDSFEAFLKDDPQENAPQPLNTTPSKSASRAARSDSELEKRPTNPTPGDSSLRGSRVPCKSVQVDVTGKPRRSKVRLPTSILSSKPRSLPNHQFLSLEEPVRRKCRTISLTDPNVVVRGFHLLPSSVDFGTLQEGTSSAITVVMKNVGVDTCRFHVKQPPPATGLRVIYVPGPVAAGLQVELQVQLFAMCAGQTGEVQPRTCISQDIIIHTETDILYLPVTATILPERSYDIWLKDQASAHKKKFPRTGTLSSSHHR